MSRESSGKEALMATRKICRQQIKEGAIADLLQDPGGCFSCEAGKLFFALPESVTFFTKPPERPGA